MVSLRFCGPKLSICCSVLSVWGIIMLVILGILMGVNSVAFVDDLKLNEEEVKKMSPKEFHTTTNRLFTQSCYNCLIAACLYIVTLGVSVWQYYLNRRASSLA